MNLLSDCAEASRLELQIRSGRANDEIIPVIMLEVHWASFQCYQRYTTGRDGCHSVRITAQVKIRNNYPPIFQNGSRNRYFGFGATACAGGTAPFRQYFTWFQLTGGTASTPSVKVVPAFAQEDRYTVCISN